MRAYDIGNPVVANSDAFLLRLISEINPAVSSFKEGAVVLSNIRPNFFITERYKYNTLVDITGNKDKNYGGNVVFSYNRIDLGSLAFKETGTIGVEDVPLRVKRNTIEGIKEAFWGQLENVEVIENLSNGVRKYRCTIREDNRLVCFSRLGENGRVYSTEFVVFAKAGETDNAFEKSRYLG